MSFVLGLLLGVLVALFFIFWGMSSGAGPTSEATAVATPAPRVIIMPTLATAATPAP
jgi:hypothetical protein